MMRSPDMRPLSPSERAKRSRWVRQIKELVRVGRRGHDDRLIRGDESLAEAVVDYSSIALECWTWPSEKLLAETLNECDRNIRKRIARLQAAGLLIVIPDSFAAISFDIVDLYLRAGQDFPALNEVERAQYSLMLLSFLRRSENVFFQTEIRMLHSQHWSGIRESIKDIMSPPGAQACWSEIKSRLNPEFRSFVDALIGPNAVPLSCG
jgi:hypothetical protein